LAQWSKCQHAHRAYLIRHRAILLDLDATPHVVECPDITARLLALQKHYGLLNLNFGQKVTDMATGLELQEQLQSTITALVALKQLARRLQSLVFLQALAPTCDQEQMEPSALCAPFKRWRCLLKGAAIQTHLILIH
jgi:hypothetical protein